MSHVSSFWSPAVLVLALVAAGCSYNSFSGVQGSGIAKSETRTVDLFHAIELDGAADVSVTIGQPQQVTITGDDNVLPLIDTNSSNGTLVIGNHQSYHSKVGVKVVIVTAALDSFALNGSGSVKISGLSGDDFSAKIRGSGDLSADGQVGTVKASITGSGSLRLEDLKARDADVSIAGSGGASVNAEDSIDGSITGSGDIRYRGNPAKVHTNVVGSGSMRKM